MSQFNQKPAVGSSGISQLTGEVQAGPGTGSQAATVGPMQHDLDLNQHKLLIDAVGGWIRGDGAGHIFARSGPAAGGVLDLRAENGFMILGVGPTSYPRILINGNGETGPILVTTTPDGGTTLHTFTFNADGTFSVGGIVHSVTDPAAAQDAATKNYVDTASVSSIKNGDLGTPRQGALELKAGTNVTISEPSNGVFQIAATGGGSGTPVVGSNSFTAQNANIASTLLFTAAATGLYEISAYMVTTTADAAAGTVSLNLTYTDDSGAQTFSGVDAISLATVKTFSPTTFAVEVISGQTLNFNTTIDTTYGTSRYSLYISAVKVF